MAGIGRITWETIAALKTLAAGVVIQALGWEHKLPMILDIARI